MGFGPAYSLTEVFENPQHVGFWEAARRGEEVDWKGFLADYEVAVDWPACSFYEELMEAFPEAFIVLTVATRKAGTRVCAPPSTSYGS